MLDGSGHRSKRAGRESNVVDHRLPAGVPVQSPNYSMLLVCSTFGSDQIANLNAIARYVDPPEVPFQSAEDVVDIGVAMGVHCHKAELRSWYMRLLAPM